MEVGTTLRFKDRDIYVSPHSKGALPKIAVASIVLILVFGIGGFIFEENRRGRERYESKLVDSLHNWNEAKNLQGLNKSRSLELAQQVKKSVDELERLGIEDARLSALVVDMQNFLPQISGEYHVRPQLVLDLGLVAPEFSIGSVASSPGRIVVLDASTNKFVVFDFEGKNVENFDLQGATKSLNLTVMGKNIFVRDGQRIVKVDNATSETVALSDGSWGEVIFVHGFGGNLYVGDRQKVWKYTPSVSGGFGGGQDWLYPEGADFYSGAMLGAVSTAIDGSLWILGSRGEITKLTQGKRDYFTPQNLDVPLSSPQFLHTREDLENLYILDSGNKRVVVFNKKGEYQVQYLWEGMGDVKGVAVSEDKKRMLFLTNSKVYGIDLPRETPF